MRQPFQPGPGVTVHVGCGQRHPDDAGVVPGDRLGDPCPQCAAHVVGLAEDGDARDLRDVDTGRGVAHGALHVEQPAQRGVRDRLEIDLVRGVLDPQRGVERGVVQSGAQHQEVRIARIAFPLPAGAGDGGQQVGRRMRPLQRRTLFGGVRTNVVSHDRQVAQVVGAFGVDLLGAHLVVGSAVERGGRQQQHEREEQRRRRDQPHTGRDERHDHADDQQHDQVRQHPAQQRRRHQPRQLRRRFDRDGALTGGRRGQPAVCLEDQPAHRFS